MSCQQTAAIAMNDGVPTHPYHSLHLPDDAPLRLQPSPKKGWGAFATRRIVRGAMILKEKPLFVIWKPHQEITEEDLWSAFQRLAPREKQQFQQLRDNASKPFIHMTEAMAKNSFAVSEDPPAHGLFLLHSRFNHSCVPNSKIPTPDGTRDCITIFATRDIAEGEEITFCYNTDFELRIRCSRHQLLRFECDCKACCIGTAFQQLSDLRRAFIRGLQYLVHGVDMDGHRQISTPPIIFDVKLKRAAESSSITLSARLIYNLLSVFLLEEEGLLDEFMVQRLSPGILYTANAFKTASNSILARRAIAQKTWLERFIMALRLYGRADVGDHVISVQLRMLRGLV